MKDILTFSINLVKTKISSLKSELNILPSDKQNKVELFKLLFTIMSCSGLVRLLFMWHWNTKLNSSLTTQAHHKHRGSCFYWSANIIKWIYCSIHTNQDFYPHSLGQCVTPPLWSRLNYLNNHLIYCYETFTLPRGWVLLTYVILLLLLWQVDVFAF